MAGYKEPGFQDRVAAAAEARVKALAKLQAKPPVDPAVQEERAARLRAREAAQAKKREALQAEREAKQIAKREKAEEAERAAQAAIVPEKTEAERKAARDARYAARKARKK